MKVNISFSSFFSNVQETSWYNEFLNPVVSEVTAHSKVLDIGTGTGKLLQLLVNEKYSDCTGIDVNASMLAEAEKKLKGLAVSLVQVPTGAKLPFHEACFDEICICNVLFNLDVYDQDSILNQSLEVLNEKGRIIILSPSGTGTIKDIFRKFSKRNNKSFALWYALTKRSARRWNKQGMLKEYAEKNNLIYTNSMVFDGFGHLEIMERK